MTTLRDSQELFLRCVRFDPAPDALEDVFAPSPRLTARECLRVYQNMYWCRLVDALFDVFPRLAEHVGTERFTKLVCRYLGPSPQRFPELERAGHVFAPFLAELEDEGDGDLLADVARLEYAGLEVLLAPNPPTTIALPAIAAARLPFQSVGLVPAIAVVEVQSRAIAIFEGRPETRSEHRSTVLFTRPRFAVRHRVLEADEAIAIAAAREGRTVEEICASFATPERASEVLRLWFGEPIIATLSEPS